ncbi:MAG TPA: hypothetical protein VN765_02535, partial [Candidatus Acidoferrum sp.]|nr:hypothetical protein [Candidatus Acidoferrum sp.]
GSDEMGRVLSELKRKRDSFPLRIAAAGALWQKSEKLKPAMTHLIADFRRLIKKVCEQEITEGTENGMKRPL